ncbi:Vpu [Human immunodeficiency virus 1]|uniref:Protein Vpu n=3 Tax=Human immunodeficiency virus type 1 TaxID=11676 RepID=VPU_HV193|nr:RecName: Full=Protein Vpu; AltName: Full=U ORF protein; AltName: Full=Viral protein U [HIV-1 M:F1_93BR020]AAD03173.1 Vpu [Human immunodeficiency virus 1]
MSNLLAIGIAALIVALIITIVVWTIAYIEYKKLVRQRKINRLYKRISERAEDSGNESEGDAEELAALGEVGPFIPGDINNL